MVSSPSDRPRKPGRDGNSQAEGLGYNCSSLARRAPTNRGASRTLLLLPQPAPKENWELGGWGLGLPHMFPQYPRRKASRKNLRLAR